MSITSASSSVGKRSRELLDRYYTPDSLAKELIDSVSISRVASVADFACGEGSLLRAASERWPGARLYANDVDGDAVARAAARLNIQAYDSEDFLGGSFAPMGPANSRFSVVALNPPFSKQTTSMIQIGRRSVRCSRAMAFVLSSAAFLTKAGQIVAILPTSTLSGSLDQEARTLVEQLFSPEIVRSPEYGLFKGVDVSTYILRLSAKAVSEANQSIADVTRSATDWHVERGAISVTRSERLPTSGYGWVHTTSIAQGSINQRYRLPSGLAPRSCPAGALIIPRVGSLNFGKILLLHANQKEILSDCLMALKGPSRSHDVAAHRAIKANFDTFLKCYSGTGAPYTTVARISRFLSQHV
jgi:hypothetical protein